MHIYIKHFSSPFFWIAMILSIIFCLLGSWQLNRLNEKNNFITKIESSIQKDPIDLTIEHVIEIYDKIKLKGHFIDKHIFLYGRRSAMPEKDGYYLLSVFETENNERFLVSRVWMPQQTKNNFANLYQHSNDVIEIVAFAMAGEKSSMLMPKNDYEKNIWFVIDLIKAKELLGLTHDNFYLMQLKTEYILPNSAPLTSGTLNKIRNDHLEYAITWYCLAFAILAFYYYAIHKRSTNIS